LLEDVTPARTFRKVLVANRAEIAVRVCRTLREMGIASVAVYSEADRGALHVRSADEAVCIGAPAPADSYLNVAAILEAARATGAEAIHPGYGFLSQNAAFARACGKAGVVFIGPSPESMEILGDKASSRRAAQKAGVPTIPGVEGVANADAALKEAKAIGYPVLLKAVGGGGGRGMRRVNSPDELAAAFDSARREAAAAFGDDRLFLEKLVHPARHVEIQILGDGKDAIAIGERECSLQRRYQKIVEESPCSALSEATRSAMESAAVALAREARYAGAGTVEFLLGPDGAFYFLEVNTRLQVEHPVTEMRSGLDLVRAQIEVAAGGALPKKPALRGHAIEARLNAEDPYQGYLPQTGRVLALAWPTGEGVRVDAGIRQGQIVHAHYDSLLAKVIAHGRDRDDARRKLVAALEELALLGVMTNQAFLLDLLSDRDFASGETFTHTLESREWPGPANVPDDALLAAAVALHAPAGTAHSGREGADRFSPWLRLGTWGRA
ncbi:MAG TPA: biotin carboxylase N-terminal domain-containing protein, partial [Candidatus Eisenbacteria bacterium]|nr:biotin carboxylase N-terminal domain-containing protein [Candidatus Eisenbacteria bacterium]